MRFGPPQGPRMASLGGHPTYGHARTKAALKESQELAAKASQVERLQKILEKGEAEKARLQDLLQESVDDK